MLRCQEEGKTNFGYGLGVAFLFSCWVGGYVSASSFRWIDVIQAHQNAIEKLFPLEMN